MESVLYQEFARLEDAHWWFRGRRAVVRSVLERHVPRKSGMRILDVGCGTGGMLPLLGELGPVEAIDSSDEALQLARQRAGPGAKLAKGQLPDGIPAGQTYELITAFDVIEHVPDPVGALHAVRAALAPQGLFVCTVPAFQFLWSRHDDLNHHYRRYTRTLLDEQLRAAGFRVVWSSYFNALLFPPIAAVRLSQKVLGLASEGGSDFQEAPPLLNRALDALFSSERFLVPRVRLPFGVSLIAVATPAP